jgi:hypothetical protein
MHLKRIFDNSFLNDRPNLNLTAAFMEKAHNHYIYKAQRRMTSVTVKLGNPHSYEVTDS